MFLSFGGDEIPFVIDDAGTRSHSKHLLEYHFGFTSIGVELARRLAYICFKMIGNGGRDFGTYINLALISLKHCFKCILF